ncbi:hypothetical protein [Halostella litorea]|uniref:hypothetical protein n=1 Tax=Halostella litorea TaxID=2528831 RepID=UPI0010927C26|nr:hypothetical protein [Halostella litorea]
MTEQPARTDDAERCLYGAAQHERPRCSPEWEYGEPQHETDVENPFSAAEITADSGRDAPGTDLRTPRPAAYGHAQPATD